MTVYTYFQTLLNWACDAYCDSRPDLYAAILERLQDPIIPPDDGSMAYTAMWTDIAQIAERIRAKEPALS